MILLMHVMIIKKPLSVSWLFHALNKIFCSRCSNIFMILFFFHYQSFIASFILSFFHHVSCFFFHFQFLFFEFSWFSFSSWRNIVILIDSMKWLQNSENLIFIWWKNKFNAIFFKFSKNDKSCAKILDSSLKLNASVNISAQKFSSLVLKLLYHIVFWSELAWLCAISAELIEDIIVIKFYDEWFWQMFIMYNELFECYQSVFSSMQWTLLMIFRHTEFQDEILLQNFDMFFNCIYCDNKNSC